MMQAPTGEQGAPPQPKGPPSSAIVDITNAINMSTSFSTNIDPRFPMENLFRGDERLVCQTDCDEQAIFHFKFKSKMKLHSLWLSAPSSNEEEIAKCPKVVKLYINRNTFSFDDGDDVEEGGIEPTQAFTLEPSTFSSKSPLLLQGGRFASVSSLTIFISTKMSEGDEEVSVLDSIKIHGAPLDCSDFADWKPIKG